eukprot:GFYU01003908.1.p1 GENE.GFYU01003908.1~~GFYU01003908.1.p1  ORF type:complete len:241 (-),score=71.80 GFYU01003908.1:102-776(-)
MSILKFLLVALLVVAPVFVLADEAENSDVVILTSENFEEQINKGVWFIEFYAPWCGHCKRLAPVWEELATTLKANNIFVGKVDVPENRDIGRRFDIRGYPTLKLVVGKDVYSYMGGRSLEDLKTFAEGGFKGANSEPLPPPESPLTMLTEPLIRTMTIIEKPLKAHVFLAVFTALLLGCLCGCCCAPMPEPERQPMRAPKSESAQKSDSADEPKEKTKKAKKDE